MTAQDLQAIAAEAARETAEYKHLTETTQLTGRVFDHQAPLPPMPTHRTKREWENEQDKQ